MIHIKCSKKLIKVASAICIGLALTHILASHANDRSVDYAAAADWTKPPWEEAIQKQQERDNQTKSKRDKSKSIHEDSDDQSKKQSDSLEDSVDNTLNRTDASQSVVYTDDSQTEEDTDNESDYESEDLRDYTDTDY